MTCINCSNAAVWEFKTPGINARLYCNTHLPSAYRGTSAVSAAPKEEPAPVEEAPRKRRTKGTASA